MRVGCIARNIALNSKSRSMNEPVAAGQLAVACLPLSTLFEEAVSSHRVVIFKDGHRGLRFRLSLLKLKCAPKLFVVNRADVEENSREDARNRRIDREQPAFALLARDVKVLDQCTDHK